MIDILVCGVMCLLCCEKEMYLIIYFIWNQINFNPNNFSFNLFQKYNKFETCFFFFVFWIFAFSILLSLCDSIVSSVWLLFMLISSNSDQQNARVRSMDYDMDIFWLFSEILYVFDWNSASKWRKCFFSFLYFNIIQIYCTIANGIISWVPWIINKYVINIFSRVSEIKQWTIKTI